MSELSANGHRGVFFADGLGHQILGWSTWEEEQESRTNDVGLKIVRGCINVATRLSRFSVRRGRVVLISEAGDIITGVVKFTAEANYSTRQLETVFYFDAAGKMDIFPGTSLERLLVPNIAEDPGV